MTDVRSPVPASVTHAPVAVASLSPMQTTDVGCLSVVMPCYNEQATVTTIASAVLVSPYVGD